MTIEIKCSVISHLAELFRGVFIRDGCVGPEFFSSCETRKTHFLSIVTPLVNKYQQVYERQVSVGNRVCVRLWIRSLNGLASSTLLVDLYLDACT